MADYQTTAIVRRVLLVLPQPLVAQLQLVFEEGGWAVESASSGQEAINRIWSVSFDALVATARLSDMRGDVLFLGATSILPQLRTCTLLLLDDEVDEAIARTTGCSTLPLSADSGAIVGRIESLVDQLIEL